MNKLKTQFLKCLEKTVRDNGFEFVPERGGFVKKVAYGQLRFTFLFYEYEGVPGFEINPLIQVRFEDVEKLFHELSYYTAKQRKGTTTIGCSIENYLGDKTGKFRHSITNREEVVDACAFYKSLYDEIVIDFFIKYNSLKSLHSLINTESSDLIPLINPIFRGRTGLIVSHLLCDDSYASLKLKYADFYSNYANGFYSNDYSKVVAVLESEKNAK